MKTLIAAAALMTAVVAVIDALSPAQRNDTIPATAQTPQKISPQSGLKNDTRAQTSPVNPQAPQVLEATGGDTTEPSGSLSLVVYAAVLVTILAMIYLVVRNFRMRYDTVRAERYGFRIRRGRTNHEVQPLSRDDEDEEILFDVRGNLR